MRLKLSANLDNTNFCLVNSFVWLPRENVRE